MKIRICDKCDNSMGNWCLELAKSTRGIVSCPSFTEREYQRLNFNLRDDKTETLIEKRNKLSDRLADGEYMLSDDFED